MTKFATLKKLNDHELIFKTQSAVSEEKRISALVLEHLHEINQRKLYLQKGYSSLHDMLERFFGYSSAAAARRASAAQLMTDLPDLGQQLEKGELSITQMATASRFFKKERFVHGNRLGVRAKKNILNQIKAKSTRETEKILISHSSAPAFEVKKEMIRQRQEQKVISVSETLLRIVVSDEVIEKIERVKNILSHRYPVLSLSKLLEILLDQFLERNDPLEKAKRAVEKGQDLLIPRVGHTDRGAAGNLNSQVSLQSQDKPEIKSRHVPRRLQHEVWLKSQGKCQYRDPKTRHLCGSKYRLQIEHIRPFAAGGRHETKNLTLYCQRHNLLMAEAFYGRKKMEEKIRGS